MQKQQESLLEKILKYPLNNRENVLDKLFQGFFKLLEMSVSLLSRLTRKKK